ncbi:unnamed protein product [Rodentolepis nana]|uniref:RING-type domain-containing protein n=1 Tax=Rodentolepis nana TaxID=102285 RepID=A0A0R3TXJ3_RODNA|nr:unnamed protein product [Rodentolepis nana]
MTAEIECAICLEVSVDPHTPPNCNHYYCKACFEKLQPNNGSLLCPQCRQPFKLADIKPYNVPQLPMKYCLDITCKPGNGCTKIHISDLCPRSEKLSKYSITPPTAEKVKALREEEDEVFKIPPKASYCFDITCPGGANAKCGKKHESDLLIGPLVS